MGKDIFPRHLALTFDQKIERKYECSSKEKGKRGRGRPPVHELIVGYNGYCSAMHKHGCPTTFHVGFTEAAVQSMLQVEKPVSVPLSIQFNGSCIHKKGVPYGQQLHGFDRQQVLDEFTKKRKTPAEFTKDQYGGDVFNGTVDTGNHAHRFDRSMAFNLSHEASRKEWQAKGSLNVLSPIYFLLIRLHVTRI